MPPLPLPVTTGTDGCHSSPLAFLKTEGLSPNNTFVSTGVLTLQPAEQRQVLDASWTESEASVQLPSAEEQVAADEAPPGSPAADTAWRGCIVGNGSFVAGTTLAVLDSIPSAEACCRECRSRYAVPGGCTVWNYCGRPGGCRWEGVGAEVGVWVGLGGGPGRAVSPLAAFRQGLLFEM
jgi:hypothetical protein